jgi:spore coat polysaccharide biosynthesis protein SpsF
MNITIVVQARTGSTRLPGKVLLPLVGMPLILRQLERVRRTRHEASIVVAIPRAPSENALADICATAGYLVYRGDEYDLIDRHLRAAQMTSAQAVVKIPSDCPLIDPAVVDKVISAFIDHQHMVDYVGNLHPASYPDGNDVEIFSIEVLERAWQRASKGYEREHTTPWMWDGNPSVRCMNVLWESGLDLSMSHRWTLDYPEDFMFVRAVYELLYHSNPRFGMYDILQLLENHPEIAGLNAHLAGVNWYRNHLDELITVRPGQTREHPSSSAA